MRRRIWLGIGILVAVPAAAAAALWIFGGDRYRAWASWQWMQFVLSLPVRGAVKAWLLGWE